jgi:hypothetical protein
VHAALDLLNLLLLACYAVVMTAIAANRRRCALDWRCDARTDSSLALLQPWQSALDSALSAAALLGICVNLRTGYVDAAGHIVAQPAAVAVRYLTSWFLVSAEYNDSSAVQQLS